MAKNETGNLTVYALQNGSALGIENVDIQIVSTKRPSGHFKSPPTFTAKTRLSGEVSFKNIPLGTYDVYVSREGYVSATEKNVLVNISGTDSLGNFCKPHNTVSLKLEPVHFLSFTGSKLCWIKAGKEHKCWVAVSGGVGHQKKEQQNLPFKGPLPEGEWDVPQSRYQQMPDRDWVERVFAELSQTKWPGGKSSWGRNRVWLQPRPGTNTHGRTGFSIHGGDTPGSAGCVDLTTAMPDFASEFVSYGKDLVLKVKYQ